MSIFKQFLVCFKKEFALQSASRLSILNRLLIGPVISLATSGILYAGFFRIYPSADLPEISGGNYLTYILFGFMGHTVLNSGYYFFSARILGEWGQRTLPLLLLSPCNRVLLLSGLGSMEAVRCSVIGIICLLVVGLPKGGLIGAFLGLALIGTLLFVFSLILGLFRALLAITREGRADLADNFYLGFVFTTCPYIPKQWLPGFLRPICEMNPAYHACLLMRNLWEGEGITWPHFSPFAAGIVGVFLTVFLIYRVFRFEIRERLL